MKQKYWSIFVGLFLIATMVFAACGGGQEATATSPPEPTEPQAMATAAPAEPTATMAPEPTEPPAMPGADKQGGTLIMAFYQEPELLNPLIRTQTVATIAGTLFERGLLDVMPDGSFAPDLAKEVPTPQNGGVSEDGLIITYNLKEGLEWSDGEPFTCDDVKFTWETIVNPDSGAVSTTGYQDIASVECPDDYTVVVTYNQFFAPYLTLFDAILPRHGTGDPADMQNWDYNRNPDPVLGGFLLDEWVSGDHMTVVRNEKYEYWPTEGQPYLDSIILRWIESREVGKQLIQTGEVDFVWDLIEADIPEAENWPGVVISSPPSPGTERLLLNLRDPEMDAPCVDFLRENPSWHWALGDPKVREAIELGIDKHTITDKLLYGLAPVGTAEINLGWATPDIPESEYSMEKAQALLEEAGWTDTDGDGIRECHGCPYAEEGKVLRLKLQTTSGNALREQTEQVIIEMMNEIGIDMFIENVPSSELFGSYSSGAFRKHGQFDILMYTTNPEVDPHSQMTGYYSSDNIPCDDNSGKGYNYSRWINDAYDEQMQIAGSSPDLEVRKAAYQKASELIATDRPHIYLYDRLEIDFYRDVLKGFESNVWQYETWSAPRFWLDK
jgi:peptide/nickel transport system substrate-binding protein